MRLSNALAMLSPPSGSEKTAAVAPPVTSSASSSDVAAANLQQALKEATAPEPANTKTAGQASPVEDLAKLAADVAGAEHEAMVKEAQLYGAAVADGFVARLAQYQDASSKLAGQGVVAAPTKTASVGDDFEKFAAENPDLVREAHDLGYQQTKEEITKLAEAAYVNAFNGTVEGIYKLACDSFANGFADTVKILEASR